MLSCLRDPVAHRHPYALETARSAPLGWSVSAWWHGGEESSAADASAEDEQAAPELEPVPLRGAAAQARASLAQATDALAEFDTWGRSRQQLEAEAAVQRATAQDVARQVCVALDRSQAAEAFLGDHARALADRRRSLRERTERLFQAGEAEYGDLAVARRDEVEARLALLDAEGAAAAARVLLEAALGRLPCDDP